MSGLTAETARQLTNEARAGEEQFRLAMQHIAGEIRHLIASTKRSSITVRPHVDEFFVRPLVEELRKRGFTVEPSREHRCIDISW